MSGKGALQIAPVPADRFWPGAGEIRLAGRDDKAFACIGSRDGERFLFTAPFDQHDAGRSQSRRPKQTSDCTVRALATSAGAAYDDAYEALLGAGRKAGRGFNFRAWAKTNSFNGYRFVWVAFPAVKGMWRVNPVTFALACPEGRFILRTSKHVLACVNGRISDTSRGAEASCVYGAWVLVHTGERS